VSVWVLLVGLTSLWFTAYEQWSGPTPGWAATAFSFVGFLVFCDWVGDGAPAIPGPHDPDLGRSEMIACTAGLLANVLLVAGIFVGLFGARRMARALGRIALGLGVVSIVLLKFGTPVFKLGLGGYLWLAAMALLAFSQLKNNSPETPAEQAGSFPESLTSHASDRILDRTANISSPTHSSPGSRQWPS
jgi:hypothetical protein